MKAETMRTIQCTADTYGYLGRYWKQGEHTTLPRGAATPPHFRIVAPAVPRRPSRGGERRAKP